MEEQEEADDLQEIDELACQLIVLGVLRIRRHCRPFHCCCCDACACPPCRGREGTDGCLLLHGCVRHTNNKHVCLLERVITGRVM